MSDRDIIIQAFWIAVTFATVYIGGLLWMISLAS